MLDTLQVGYVKYGRDSSFVKNNQSLAVLTKRSNVWLVLPNSQNISSKKLSLASKNIMICQKALITFVSGNEDAEILLFLLFFAIQN